MTSDEIKEFIISQFFLNRENLSKKNIWKRELKIKFRTYTEFNDKFERFYIQDMFEESCFDFRYGTPPADNTNNICRLFEAQSDEGDFQVVVITNEADDNIVFAAGAVD